jgi:ADP-heptose:LPS heptosyltransferase
VWRRALLGALALPFSLGRRRGAAHGGRAVRAPAEPPSNGTDANQVPPTPWERGRLARPVRAASDRETARCRPRILLIRPDHLGDLLLTTPALALLREALPAARLEALIGPWAVPALAGRTELDHVETCAFPGFTREPAGSPLAPYWRLAVEARRLRRARYDAALVLRADHWWGAALAAYAGIPLRLGYGVAESRGFLTHALPPDLTQHSVDENWRLVAALVRLLGRPLPRERPGPVVAVPLPAGELTAAQWLGARGVPARARLVAIHPGTGAAVKLWPSARWSAVGDALARRLEARVVVTGSAAERALVAAVVGGMAEPAVDAAGALDWEGLGGLFARSALVLGVDSGPLHLAAALGVTTVHVFGPTAPARFGPRGRGAHRVVRVPLPCSPCGNLIAPPCGARAEPACLQAVASAAVVEAALAAVDAAGEWPVGAGLAVEAGTAGVGRRRA